MAILQTKHTMAAVNKIRAELSVFIKIVRVASMGFFALYYAYLIYTNIASAPHLLAYLTLFSLVIGSFVVEVSLKSKELDTRKRKRIKLEIRRKISLLSKGLKYLAKSITVGFALYAAITHPTSQWDLIFDLVSCGILVVSALSEVVTHIINRYIDYLQVGFELDMDDSSVTKLFFGKQQQRAKKVEKNIHKARNESQYTSEEERIALLLVEEANKMQAEREQRLQRQIDEGELTLAKLTGKKLSKKQKNNLKQKYDSLVLEASLLLDTPKKLVKQMAIADGLVAKLPQYDDATSCLDNLVTLASNYIDGMYTQISREAVAMAVAAVNYFVATTDDDSLQRGVQVDVAYIISLCLKNIKKDVKTFVDWQITTQQ